MKKFIQDFAHRGLIACGLGPVVLAVIYWILHNCVDIDTLTVSQVCTGILTLTGLAFVAGGMNAIYQIERLPLLVSILIHGIVLYIGYLATYLMNGWLVWGIMPVIIFSAIFVAGYTVIWLVVYFIIRKKTAELNGHLQKWQMYSEKDK